VFGQDALGRPVGDEAGCDVIDVGVDGNTRRHIEEVVAEGCSFLITGCEDSQVGNKVAEFPPLLLCRDNDEKGDIPLMELMDEMECSIGLTTTGVPIDSSVKAEGTGGNTILLGDWLALTQEMSYSD